MNASVDWSKSNNTNDDSILGIPTNEWDSNDVINWAKYTENLSQSIVKCLREEEIDGEVLLELNENDIRDFRYHLKHNLTFNDIKKFWSAVRSLQMRHKNLLKNAAARSNDTNSTGNNRYLLPSDSSPLNRLSSLTSGAIIATPPFLSKGCYATEMNCLPGISRDTYNISPPISLDGRASQIPPEFFKTGISLGYSFLVTWITSFVMVIVHERVPDMKRYPPLPDIFLDNVPHIPWAFSMCEITGTLLFVIWLCVCIFHKYRTVLLRRFFALAGTVFLLRCVTMLITSLSVPGTHLQCNQKDYAIDDSRLSTSEALQLRITRAYIIWSGLGMSIQGVRTCGDYMFSGHTVALTLLNFFITEYTPRHLYFLHTLTWLLNMFGIFFILAAHEHYSIDVFIAFYITSRLFLYYHTLANNQALMSQDSSRTRIWFPMFSYFESSVDGIIPNEYDNLHSLFENFLQFFINIKDSLILKIRHYVWDANFLNIHNVATSTVPQSSLSIKNDIKNDKYDDDNDDDNDDDIDQTGVLQLTSIQNSYSNESFQQNLIDKKDN